MTLNWLDEVDQMQIDEPSQPPFFVLEQKAIRSELYLSITNQFTMN